MSDKTEVVRRKIELGEEIAKAIGEQYNYTIPWVKILSCSFSHNNRKCRVGVYYEDGEFPASKKANEAARREAPIDCELRDYMKGYCKCQVDIDKANFKQVLKEDE